MRLAQTALVAIAVAALLLGGLFALPMGGRPAPDAQSGLQTTFIPPNFPYGYGVPTVPATVGAQGIQGPNVPFSSVGPQVNTSQIGTSGHLGPVNVTNPQLLGGSITSLTVTVRNGTVYSSVAAVGQTVKLENATYGTTLLATTSGAGVAAFGGGGGLTTGWYILSIIPTTPASWVAFTQVYHLTTLNPSITRYLTPTANSTIAVNNGGATHGTIYAPFNSLEYPSGIGQVTVNLLNESNSGARIATSLTLANGSATFTNVNPAFSYATQWVGWATVANGVRYALSNVTSGNFPVSGGGHTNFGSGLAVGLSTWTSVVTGSTANINAYPPWTLSGNVVVTGGTFVVSNAIEGPSVGFDKLTFVNALVVLNGSAYGTGAGARNHLGVAFVNSTIVSLSDYDWLGIGGGPTGIGYFYLNNSAFFGSGIAGGGYTGNPLPCSLCQNSFIVAKTAIWPPTGIIPSTTSPAGMVSGLLKNVEFYDNFDVPLANVTLSHVAIYRSNLVSSDQSIGFDVNSYETLTDVRVLSNSTLVLGSIAATTGTNGAKNITVSNSALNDSMVEFVARYVNVTNSWVNETYLWGGGAAQSAQTSWAWGKGLSAPSVGRFSHDYLTEQAPTYVSFATYYSNALPYYSSAKQILWNWPTVTNLSLSILRLDTFPSNNLSIGLTNVAFYDDWLFDNSSTTNVAFMLAHLSKPEIAVDYITTGQNEWMNYTSFGCSSFCSNINRGNVSWSHVLFPWVADGAYPLLPIQLFGAGDVLPKGVASFVNDTFAYEFFNSTWWHILGTQYGFYYQGTTQWVEDGNPPSANHGWFNVTHDTFLARPNGMGKGSVPADVANICNGVRANVTNDLFANLDTYDVGPNATLTPAYGWNVLAESHPSTNLSSNWFLNLNNKTMPVGTNWYGAAPTAWASSLHLWRNHFYWSATPQASGPVDPTGPRHLTQAQALPVETFSHIPLYANVPYELGLGSNTSVGYVNGGQLLFNESLRQTSVPNDSLSAQTWSWGFAPDANGSGVVLTLDYRNGLAAGPQPNFEWRGYNYSEQVEAAQVEIGVNSTNAPNVTIDLSASPSTSYYLWAENATNGAVLFSNRVTSDANGTVNATFVPKTDPLTTIFTLSDTPFGGPTGFGNSALPILELVAVGLVFLGVVGFIVGAVVADRRRKGQSDSPARTYKMRAERRRYDRIVRGVERSNREGRTSANPYAIAQRDLNRRRGP